MPDMAEYNNCLSNCSGVSDLIQKADCSNTCIGNWQKSQKNYNKCVTSGSGEQQTEKPSAALVLPIILLIIAAGVGITIFIIKKYKK